MSTDFHMAAAYGQKQVEQFFELSIDMLCITGFDGFFKRLNPIWTEVLGFSEEELMAQPFMSFVHPDDREATAKASEVSMAGSKLISFRNRYRCRDGSYRLFDWSCAPSQEQKAFCCVARDITERERERERLEHLLRASRVVLYTSEARGDFRITFMSNNAIDLLGFDAAAFTSRSSFWMGRVHPDDVDHVRAELARAQEREPHAFEYRFLHRDGAHRWIHNECRLALDKGGKPVELIGSWQDVTERRRSEELIRKQATALTELSTPLIPINDHVLVMPLIGTMDSQRAKQVLDTLLNGVSVKRASVAILDITGVAVVDTQVANALLTAAKAVRLLGAEVVLTGIRPDVAHTLVGLGIDMNDIITRSTLQSGIGYAMRRASSPQQDA